ncbi:sodium-coupled neutral amino acid transporter 5 [Brachyhypopomus gauderio]|uniref:sodium-coupled neutral amino acid transporter 5 n=1 Tax=Brachyhypopomus gauderio TaxID=698409 RepID=UPI0040423248
MAYFKDVPNDHHKTEFEKNEPGDKFDSPANMEEQEHFLHHTMDKKQFTDPEGKTSLGMSVFNLSNAIMGSGILGLAYAMASTGIILFLILLVLIAILSAYSIHLLLMSANVVGVRAYETLGLRAFGHAGKVIAACVVTIHNIGAMSTYLYIVKIELPFVILGFLDKGKDFRAWYVEGSYLIFVVSACIILPLALMRHIGYLGYTSGLSLSCMVFFLISVIYETFVHPLNSRKSLNGSNTVIPTVMSSHNVSNFTATNISTVSSHSDSHEAKLFTLTSEAIFAIPIMAFAFVCHPEVLPIYTELRKPTKKRMQKVANVSILAMFIMYLLTAVFGYLTFYDKVEDELLKNYDANDKLMLCVRLAVLVAVTLTVPVVLFPIRRAVLQLCRPDKPFGWGPHIATAVCLLVFVNILVVFVPNIKDIFGFIGATTAPSLIFILPGMFYIRIIPHNEEPMRSKPKILALMFVGLGFVFMIGSSSLMINGWVTGRVSKGGH